MNRTPSMNALCASLTLITLTASANADLLAYEPFEYGRGSSLAGQDGGLGFGGPWTQSQAFGAQTTTISAGLTYSTLEVRGNACLVDTGPSAPGGVNRHLGFTLGDDNTTSYFGFLMQVGTGNAWANYSAFALGGNVVFGYNTSRWPAQGFHIADGGGNSPVGSGIAAVPGDTVFIVVRADFLPGNDRFTMYVNPPVNGIEPASGVVKDTIDLGTGIAGVSFQTSGSHGYDELRIGTSYADVVLTPLPCAGDIDDDGATNVFDFGLFAASFGASELAHFTGGDMDGDGDVDVFDFGIFSADFGCTTY